MSTLDEQVEILQRQISVNETARRALSESTRQLELEIDDLRLAAKPEFPTADQVDGIKAALILIEQDYKPKSHHGDPIGGDYTSPVRVGNHGFNGWLSVHHRSPYSKRRMGGKLWGFTEDEQEALLRVVRDEGFTVYDSWPHDNGLSIVTNRKRAS